MQNDPLLKTVMIPACAEHEGYKSIIVILEWKCPVCGEPRGNRFETTSFDGSHRLTCNGWINYCGHGDKYDEVRKEAAANGYNRI